MLLCDLAMHAVWSQSEHEKVIFICTLMFLHLCILSVQTKKASITTLSTPLVMPAAGSNSHFQMTVVFQDNQALSADF